MKKLTFLSVVMLVILSANVFAQTNFNWKWVHQYPQGNTLRWVKMFDANNWYAVGYYGAFLKTSNAGVNWSVSFLAGGMYGTYGAPKSNLYSAWFFNQNTGLVCGTSGWIARTTNAGVSWDSIGTGTTSALYGMHFVDANTGYVGGASGTVLKTTNAGLNWSALTTGVTTTIYNIYALGDNVYAPTTAGNILISTNGGTSFTQYSTGASITVYDALFLDANTGFVCGTSGSVRLSTNGGVNWTALTTGTTSAFYELYARPFTNPGGIPYNQGFEGTLFPPTGWHVKNISGPSYTWVRSTSQYYNGVASAYINYDYPGPGDDWLVTPQWSIQSGDSLVFFWKNAFSSPYPPDSLYIRVSTTDTAVSSFTNIVAAINTANAPFTWTRFAYSLNSFAGQNVYIAFQHRNTDGNGGYLDSVFINRQASTSYEIYAMGDSYSAYKSTTLGTNWTAVSILDPLQPWTSTWYTITSNGNNFLVGGAFGLLNKSSNNGANWSTMTTFLSPATKYDVWAQYNDGKVWVVGAPGSTGVTSDQILYSSNGGNTWTVQNSGTNYSTFYDIAMLNANTGYVCGSYGIIRKTTNGGANWDSVPSPMPWTSSNILRKMQWFDANTGYVSQTASNTGGYFFTTNGGNTWNTAYTGIDDRIYAFQIVTDSVAYAANYTPQVMKTTNGGANWTLLAAPMGGGFIYDLQFFNANTGYVSATSGARLVRTTNGGSSWDTVYTPITSGFYSMKWLNVNVGHVFGSTGSVIRTTNGGTTWTIENVGGGITLYGSYLRDSDSLFACGTSGAVFKKSLPPVTSIEWAHQIPTTYVLKQNYPNPFNPTTTIEFALPKTGFVTLKVYDIAGREVANLINNMQLNAGTVKYKFDGTNLASGVYFYTLLVNGEKIDTKKMVLVK